MRNIKAVTAPDRLPTEFPAEEVEAFIIDEHARLVVITRDSVRHVYADSFLPGLRQTMPPAIYSLAEIGCLPTFDIIECGKREDGDFDLLTKWTEFLVRWLNSPEGSRP